MKNANINKDEEGFTQVTRKRGKKSGNKNVTAITEVQSNTKGKDSATKNHTVTELQKEKEPQPEEQKQEKKDIRKSKKKKQKGTKNTILRVKNRISAKRKVKHIPEKNIIENMDKEITLKQKTTDKRITQDLVNIKRSRTPITQHHARRSTQQSGTE